MKKANTEIPNRFFVTALCLLLITLFVKTPSVISQISVLLEDIHTIGGLDLHPDGQILAVGGEYNNQTGIWMYDLTSEVVTDVIDTSGSVSTISWSGDGNLLAARIGGGNAEIYQVFDFNTKLPILTLESSVSLTNDILWSIDSSKLAITTASTVQIVDVATGETANRFAVRDVNSQAQINAVVWDDSTNQRLYTLSTTLQTIFVWDSATGRFFAERCGTRHIRSGIISVMGFSFGKDFEYHYFIENPSLS